LSSSVPDSQIFIEGYSIQRSDRRDGRKGGGTLFYYKNQLNVIERKIKCEFESTWIDVSIRNQTILVGCIYRPPNFKNFLNYFEKTLSVTCLKRKNILLLGDFNINIKDENSQLTSKFKDIIYAHNLKNIITVPTRVTQTTSSSIDLILTSLNPTGLKITISGAYDPGISDHHLIYTTTNIIFTKRQSKTSTVHKIECLEALKKDLEYIPWQILEIFDDVDDTAYFWNYLYSNAIQSHTKVLKLKQRQLNKPWIDKKLRKELNLRFKLLNKAKRTNDQASWKAYKLQRNTCKRLLRSAESDFWKNKFNNSDSTKSFWKTVNLFHGKNNTKSIGTITKDGVHYSTDEEKQMH